MSRLWLLCAGQALAGCSLSPYAQPAPSIAYLPALKGDYFRIKSKDGLGTYHVYVRYPEDYAKRPGETFPTVYLLDGDSLFPYLAPHHLFLTYDDKLPEAIIVGIAYGSFAPPINRRDRDFGDGVVGFQQFLKGELIPAVERRTRSDPAQRILVGQSRGGAFVLYSALSDPDLFWGRIASNPSFGANRDYLMRAQPPGPTRKDLRVAIVSGTRNNAQGRQGAEEWVAAQTRSPHSAWSLRAIQIDGGTHAADMPEAYRRSMNWLFDNQEGA
jgi:predicted alpha/beta superfamily hydrolase